MSAASGTAVAAKRPLRILWASVYCLLDTSSGASMAVREMLRQLCLRGYEVAICGATIYDNERGRQRIADKWDVVEAKRGTVISVKDDPLIHYLHVTASPLRDAMTSYEENQWLLFYTATLDKLKPDLVFYYGGQALDMMLADEAKQRGIPVVAYLANPNYAGHRWHRDVDLILTDSAATAQLYAERNDYDVTPVGSFIDPLPVVAGSHLRERLLFINPSLEKGAAVVVQLALLMEQRRPDIVFEVVESRGNWQQIVQQVTTALGQPRDSLPNVVVTPNTDDVRPIFGRARVLLAPSLWWESAGRVIAEALLNGIPAIIPNRGGPLEMMVDAGFKVEFPPACYEAPYTQLPSEEFMKPVVDVLVRFYEDEPFYAEYVGRAYRVGRDRHSLAVNTARLERALAPWFAKGAARPDALPAPGGLLLPVPAAPGDPKVSVIFPVGNRTEYLREAIESVLRQSFTDFEFLIIADGVSAPVLSILSGYADARIRLIRLPLNMGISAARNAGLAAARAPYIALMDSDDVALPQRLATQYVFLQAHPEVTVCSSNSIKFFPDGSKVAMRYPETDGMIKARLLIVDSSILNPTAMYRADFVRAHRLRYDPNFPPDDDHRFYVDMMRIGATFYGLHEELLMYRRHESNYTNDMTGADAIKTRVRELLVPLFFPKLRGDEMQALLAAMRETLPSDPKEIRKSLAAIDKAQKEERSFVGEDRAELQNILRAAGQRLDAAGDSAPAVT
ncbi:MAG: glycosyltransferase [Rhodoferax sp.]